MKNVVDKILKTSINLVDPTPDLYGLTSTRVKLLLNNCLNYLPKNEAYLEIGCYQGATLISTLLNHKNSIAYACDNFSEFIEENPRDIFNQNLLKYSDQIPNITFFDQDSFELANQESPFEYPIGIYFYDGDHSQELQRKAITQFSRFFANEVLIFVDDWNWQQVQDGTWEGISEINYKKIWHKSLPARMNGDRELWWNGIGVFHLEMLPSRNLEANFLLNQSIDSIKKALSTI